MTNDEPKAAPESAAAKRDSEARPAAGPHARDELVNKEATPGAGSLPDAENGQNETGGIG